MKKITIFIFLLWIITVQAQEQSTTIKINPFGNDDVVKSMKYGERAKFMISNVNTFKINGYVTSKPVNIDFEVPSIISDIVNQMPKDTFKSNSSQGKGSIPASKVEKEDSITIKQEDFKKIFGEFLTKYQKINLYINLEDNLYGKLSDSIFIRDTAVLKKNCKSQYLAYYDEINLDSNKEEITKCLFEIDIKFTSLKLLYEELSDMQKKDSVIMNGTLKTSDGMNAIIIKNAIVKLDKKKYFEEEFSFAKKIVEQLNDSKNRIAIIDKAHAGIDLYNKIEKENFTIYTESYAAVSDEVFFTPVLKYANGKVAKEFNPYQIRTVGGVKVNFSSGYLLSFKGDDNYTLYRDSTGNIKGASAGNKNNITHAIGALAHVYRRSAKNCNIAFSSGISLANNASLGFYLGVSLLCLEKNRLGFSLGISFVQLKQLNTANLNKVEDKENNYEFLSVTDNTIKYDMVYKDAIFVGVTYNLSSNK